MTNARADWLARLDQLARPVLTAAAAGTLHQDMPMERHPDCDQGRIDTRNLEAVGRVLAGIAPWLEAQGVGDAWECTLRHELTSLAHEALRIGSDPEHPDWWGWGAARQSVVDCAFVAQALLRAPSALVGGLPSDDRQRLARAMIRTRAHMPGFNNWLLFAACTEAALPALGAERDDMRIDYALRQHEQWYLGDGHYGDGPSFHADYYNSFVIQPMMLDVLEAVVPAWEGVWNAILPALRARLGRYAAVQERMIHADGSWPPIGRSVVYRCGAFHALSTAAWKGLLPADLAPAQVRCALAAAIERCLSPEGTFDQAGWLRIGLASHQPALGESYITTASTYLACFAFPALGLAAEHPFWSDADQPWTQVRIWQLHENLPADHALGANHVAMSW